MYGYSIMEENTIVNRVAGSGLITLNLEDLHPRAEIAEIDLKQLLVGGFMLREKDLREFIRSHDWQQYQGKIVAVHCSVDAVVPTWAYMLLSIALQPFSLLTVFGNRQSALTTAYHDALRKIDWTEYRGAKVVVKGCSDVHVPESVFVEAAGHLREVAASIMYGEPCSTVPLYKKANSGG